MMEKAGNNNSPVLFVIQVQTSGAVLPQEIKGMVCDRLTPRQRTKRGNSAACTCITTPSMLPSSSANTHWSDIHLAGSIERALASRPENTRYSGRSYSASSIAASDRPNHCCKMPHGTPHSSPLERLVCVCALHLS